MLYYLFSGRIKGSVVVCLHPNPYFLAFNNHTLSSKVFFLLSGPSSQHKTTEIKDIELPISRQIRSKKFPEYI